MDGRHPWHTAIACTVAAVLGLAASLFTAGPALFADGSFAERPPVLVVSIAMFALLGAAISFVSPGSWKPVAVTLAISAFPVALLFGRDTVGQSPMMLLAVGFVLGDSAAGAFGALMGAKMRSARRSHSH